MSVNINVRNVIKRYGDNTVIPDLSVRIREGEFFTLLGPSGCGKTTLLRMIAGFNSIEGGDICFNDKRINDLDPAKRNIGMVFQNYAIFPHLSVRNNVAFGLKERKLPKAQVVEQTNKFMQLMHIDEYADRMPDRLSGGQQQRVALARALVIQPDVLLMDEPLSNLDAKLRVEMRTVIKEIQNSVGITTVYVTHDQEEAMAVSDRIAVMNLGVIQQIGTPKALYQRPANLFVASFIGRTNIFEAKLEMRGGTPYIVFEGGYATPVEHVQPKFQADAEVKVCVRPEELVISGTDEGIEAKIDDSVFLGLNTHYFVTTASGVKAEIVQESQIDSIIPKGAKVNLTVNWSDLATAPDGMTVYLYPTGNDTVDSTVRSWHFDNVQSASVTVPEQDYSVICFNQSENELAGYVFDFRDYATATVTAKDLSNLAPLAIASMSSLQSTRALNLMGVLKPVNVVKTMSLKIHVAGFNERVEVKGTLSNTPAGVTMCDRKPLPKPVDLTLPAKDWTVKATSDDEIDLDITFNSFGIFLDDETRAAGSGDDDYVAEPRVALDDSDLRNILHLEITAEDGTVTKLDYDVTQELIRQYRIAIESDATSSNSTPQFDNQFFFSYHAADTTATLVSGVGMGNVEIPEYVQHDGLSYKVTEIGSEAFRGCTYMTSISIPESVTRIRNSAFAECAGLSSLSLPQSLRLIGKEAFYQCRTLTEVTIPEQVDSLGSSAFGHCQMLTKVNYNARHCNSCNGSVFPYSSDGYTCLGVTTLNIGNQVEHIPAHVFSSLSNLKTVTIPNSVTSISSSAFEYCYGLTSVTIPSSVTSIGNNAFAGCSGLTSVTIPSGVTSIGNNAFDGIDIIYYNGSASGEPWGANKIVRQ